MRYATCLLDNDAKMFLSSIENWCQRQSTLFLSKSDIPWTIMNDVLAILQRNNLKFSSQNFSFGNEGAQKGPKIKWIKLRMKKSDFVCGKTAREKLTCHSTWQKVKSFSLLLNRPALLALSRGFLPFGNPKLGQIRIENWSSTKENQEKLKKLKLNFFLFKVFRRHHTRTYFCFTKDSQSLLSHCTIQHEFANTRR